MKMVSDHISMMVNANVERLVRRRRSSETGTGSKEAECLRCHLTHP
jgi:hypothetical protein